MVLEACHGEGRGFEVTYLRLMGRAGGSPISERGLRPILILVTIMHEQRGRYHQPIAEIGEIVGTPRQYSTRMRYRRRVYLISMLTTSM